MAESPKNRKLDGWCEAPAADLWRCPGCRQLTDPDLWEETKVGCEDCGMHDAMRCPECGECFDRVWCQEKIAKTTKETG